MKKYNLFCTLLAEVSVLCQKNVQLKLKKIKERKQERKTERKRKRKKDKKEGKKVFFVVLCLLTIRGKSTNV